jgi:hypothetical protein
MLAVFSINECFDWASTALVNNATASFTLVVSNINVTWRRFTSCRFISLWRQHQVTTLCASLHVHACCACCSIFAA